MFTATPESGKTGKILDGFRIAVGMTLKELSVRSRVDEAVLWRLMTGESQVREIRLRTLWQLADLFQCSIDMLVGRREDRVRPVAIERRVRHIPIKTKPGGVSGQRIWDELMKHGLSVSTASKMIHREKSVLHRLITGEVVSHQVRVKTFWDLADVFGVSIDYLAGRESLASHKKVA